MWIDGSGICTKCGGTVGTDRDIWGTRRVCVNCGQDDNRSFVIHYPSSLEERGGWHKKEKLGKDLFRGKEKTRRL